MNMENKKKGMVAVLTTLALVVAGMIGFFLSVPEINAEEVVDDGLLEGMGVSPNWTYSTSGEDIEINYTMGSSISVDMILSNLTMSYIKVGMLPWTEIVSWNVSEDGQPDNPYVWSEADLPGPGEYIINVTAHYWKESDDVLYRDHEHAHFKVYEGDPIIGPVSSEPYYVENGGEDSITVNVVANRLLEDLDHDNCSMNFYHKDTWEPLYPELPDPVSQEEDIENRTIRTVFELDIPLDASVGEYNLFAHIKDIWNNSEEYNETLLQINWSERAPDTTGKVMLEEDFGYEVIDLNDYFEDVNGDPLHYWFNASQFDDMNISASWDNISIDNEVNITAPPNWYGEEHFEVFVMDMDTSVEPNVAKHNVSRHLAINVSPVEDNLTVVDDNRVLINENLKNKTFDPRDLFYDPDGPVDLLVSIGYEMSVNGTNVTYTPIWNWNSTDFEVMINSTDQANSKAMILTDLESGMEEFPVTAWMNGTPVLNGSAYVEVHPVNDEPMQLVTELTALMGQNITGNITDIITDVDTELADMVYNLTEVGPGIDLNMTGYEFVIQHINASVTESHFKINVSDGEYWEIFTVDIVYELPVYTVSGTVSFEEGVDEINVTLMFGDMEVDVNMTTGAYSRELEEGTYTVSLDIHGYTMYDEDGGISGFLPYEDEELVVDQDMTKDFMVEYEEYIDDTPEKATWADIDFDNHTLEDKGESEFEITVPVKDEELDYTDITVVFVIRNKEGSDEEDDLVWFNMTWDDEKNMFTLHLVEDDLEDVKDGKLEYFFFNYDDPTERTEPNKYSFKEESDDSEIITVIVLIVLIILVLIALVFIMRKPSEEEFEEGEEEEESERTCPSCGEIITDEEAEECPYCGESLEEE